MLNEKLNNVGEKGYLLRRSLINNEAMKSLNKKHTFQIPRKKKSSTFNLHTEYSNLETISKTNNVEQDKDLVSLESNLKNKFKRNSKKNKRITFREETPSLSIKNTISYETSSFSANSIKTKSFIDKNIKLSRNKNGILNIKKTLKQLNDLTDKLGITKKTEREKYMKDKQKRVFLRNEIKSPFHEKQEKKLALFSSTAKLNKFIINDYYMSEYNKSAELGKKKLKIAQNTFEQINKDRMNELYQKSQNYFIADPERDEFYYNLTHQYENEDYNKRSYSESEVKKTIDNYYSILSKKKIKKNLKLFDKIRGLNNEEYIEINPNNDIEFSNLDRLIRIKKYKQKYFHENINDKKEKLKNEEEDVLICLSKFKPSILSKKPFRLSTLNQYKAVSGIYFGLPC